MIYQFSTRSKERMTGVHPGLILIFEEAIKISPIDFGIPRDGGVRTAERQHEMFLDPDIQTNCDGFEQPGNHQIQPGEEYGMALDFYAYINGKASWQDHHLAMVAAILIVTAKRLLAEGRISIKLRWGGTFGSNDFNGWDKPHCEAVKG